MTFSLHIWNRNEGSYARHEASDVDALRDELKGIRGNRIANSIVAVISLPDEPVPGMPTKAETSFKRLLATPAVAQAHGESFKLERAAAHLGSALLPVMSFAAPAEKVARGREVRLASHQARVRQEPLVEERYPEWFAGRSLVDVLGPEAGAVYARIGLGSVRDLGTVSREAFEEAGLGNAADIVALRVELRGLHSEAAQARRRDADKVPPQGPAASPGERREVAAPGPRRPLPTNVPVTRIDPRRRGALRKAVFDSLHPFDARTQGLLVQRLGLEGSARRRGDLSESLGVSVARIHQVEARALEAIAAKYDWPAFLRAEIDRRGPVAIADLRREDWAAGLAGSALVQLARFSADKRLHVLRIAGSEVLGEMSPTAWRAVAKRVREKLASVPYKLNQTGLRAMCALSMRVDERSYVDWMAREMSAGSPVSRRRDGMASLTATIRSMLENADGAMTEIGIRAGLATHYGRTLDPDEATRALARFMPFPGARRGLARHVLFEPEPDALVRKLLDRVPPPAEGGLPATRDVMDALYKAWPAAATEEIEAHVERVRKGAAEPAPWGWDAAREGTLRRMWGQGESSGEIARRLGTTRNSVIGKINRLKLMGEQGNPNPEPAGFAP